MCGQFRLERIERGAERVTPGCNAQSRRIFFDEPGFTPERILKRCILFEKTAYPETDEEEIIGHVLSHIEEKYGENGYLKLWMPCKRNEEGLQTLRQWLATGELKRRVKSAL